MPAALQLTWPSSSHIPWPASFKIIIINDHIYHNDILTKGNNSVIIFLSCGCFHTYINEYFKFIQIFTHFIQITQNKISQTDLYTKIKLPFFKVFWALKNSDIFCLRGHFCSQKFRQLLSC